MAHIISTASLEQREWHGSSLPQQNCLFQEALEFTPACGPNIQGVFSQGTLQTLEPNPEHSSLIYSYSEEGAATSCVFHAAIQAIILVELAGKK